MIEKKFSLGREERYSSKKKRENYEDSILLTEGEDKLALEMGKEEADSTSWPTYNLYHRTQGEGTRRKLN